MAKIGRPLKLTSEVRSRLISAVKAGNHPAAAARFAGIEQSTFTRWLERGQTDEAAGRVTDFSAFCKEIAEAEAQCEVAAVANWRQAIPDDWHAARDFLARRYPKRWAPQDKHEVSGPDGGPLELNDHGPSDAQRMGSFITLLDAIRARVSQPPAPAEAAVGAAAGTADPGVPE